MPQPYFLPVARVPQTRTDRRTRQRKRHRPHQTETFSEAASPWDLRLKMVAADPAAPDQAAKTKMAIKMKNQLLMAGALFATGLLLLFAGCTGSSDSNGQGTGTQGEIQQPSTGDQGAPVAQENTGQPQGDQAQGQQAQGGTNPNGARGVGQGRGGMGVAFVQACDGKAEGDVCTVSFRNQTVDGNCTSRNGNMTCVTGNMGAGPNPGQGPGMTGGLTQACTGKGIGDACTVTMRNQAVDGTCTNRSAGISCQPNNRAPGQGRGVPPGQADAGPGTG